MYLIKVAHKFVQEDNKVERLITNIYNRIQVHDQLTNVLQKNLKIWLNVAVISHHQ